MTKLSIGIDPGKSGGISWILGDDRSTATAAKMPPTDVELLELFYKLAEIGNPATAIIERVFSSPQMGVKSAFNFGASKGRLMMALAAAAISYDEVSPQKWQRELGCLSKGDKNVTKAKAEQLFPHVSFDGSLTRITHAVAASLLLAEYCRRLP